MPHLLSCLSLAPSLSLLEEETEGGQEQVLQNPNIFERYCSKSFYAYILNRPAPLVHTYYVHGPIFGCHFIKLSFCITLLYTLQYE